MQKKLFRIAVTSIGPADKAGFRKVEVLVESIHGGISFVIPFGISKEFDEPEAIRMARHYINRLMLDIGKETAHWHLPDDEIEKLKTVGPKDNGAAGPTG